MSEKQRNHGLLLVNKPTGITSHDVVSKVRKIFKTKEVGHSGTLDPLASGLMVVLLGEATKLSSVITEGDKSYKVQLQLGFETDTLDVTGQILKQIAIKASKTEVLMSVLASAQKLTGEFEIEIPLYSAKKINGQKLYEYARQGEIVELPKKMMNFWDIKYLPEESLESEYKYSFHLTCSKGSFIRSWVQQIGVLTGYGATMTALERTKSHDFYLDRASTLPELELAQTQNNLSSKLVPILESIKGVKIIKVKGQDEVLLSHGQISFQFRSLLIVKFNPETDHWVFAVSQSTGQVMAIIGLEPGVGFKIKRGFRF